MYLLSLRRRIYILTQSQSNVKNQMLLSVCPCALQPMQLFYSTTGLAVLSTAIFHDLVGMANKTALFAIIESAVRTCLFILLLMHKPFLFFLEYQVRRTVDHFILNAQFNILYRVFIDERFLGKGGIVGNCVPALDTCNYIGTDNL